MILYKQYKIRRAIAEDVHGIAALEKRSFATPWSEEDFERELNRNPIAVYLVAVTEEEEIVGYVGLWAILNEGHITNIAVSPEHRRKGIAAGLLDYLIKEASKYGVRKFTLEVRTSNAGAIKLYEGFGFSVEGYRKEYYKDNKEDAAIMWLMEPAADDE